MLRLGYKLSRLVVNQLLLLPRHPLLGLDQVDEERCGAVEEHLAHVAVAVAANCIAALVVRHGKSAAHRQPQIVDRGCLTEIFHMLKQCQL